MRLKWVRDTQQTVYMKEITTLQLVAILSKATQALLLQQPRLFLGTQGYICCDGRIHKSPVSKITKFLYLLPSRHLIFHVIILDVHVTLHHTGGTSATLTALRQMYWIPAARHYIKSILYHCVICNRVIGKLHSAPDHCHCPTCRLKMCTPSLIQEWISQVHCM